MPSKLVLTKKDYDAVVADPKVALQDGEEFAIVTTKNYGVWHRSIHVFARRPSSKELNAYEQLASKVKLRGAKAELEGKKLEAARVLYDVLVTRVFDLQVGRKTYPELDRDKAIALVEPLVKRGAILDMVSEVYSATQMEEREGEDPSTADDKEED
jgi:hypothetical protein